MNYKGHWFVTVLWFNGLQHHPISDVVVINYEVDSSV
jgi:hypothetical protein